MSPIRRTPAVAALLAAAMAAAAAQDRPLVTFTKRTLATEFRCEGAAAADFDNDGHPDLVAGPRLWFGPSFERTLDLYPPKTFDPKGYSDNFFAFPADLDQDGWIDIVNVGFPGKDAAWLRNPGRADAAWTRRNRISSPAGGCWRKARSAIDC